MAVGIVKLVHGRTADRVTAQRLLSGPVRLSTNNDVLHGLDGAYDFHPGFCAVVADPGLG